MIPEPTSHSPVYQGRFGNYSITEGDRQKVQVYRLSLLLAAVSFAAASFSLNLFGATPVVLSSLTWLYVLFTVALGVSLLTIHIYMITLHRLLQVFWVIGTATALVVGWRSSQPLALYVYENPAVIWGMGFTFAALSGLLIKEALCFGRIETTLLVPAIVVLLLGHLFEIWTPFAGTFMLTSCSILFLIFAARKLPQAISPDIGDKSVFEYLKQERA